MNIDFVIFWVDGNDPGWQKKKAQYKGTDIQNSDTRFRDWDLLKYWFRAVEQYAPWVHHIYFVSDSQIPQWMNLNQPKLTHVDHKDFIPDKYLPTFNSHTIEHHFHLIKGLSEHFVAFNDDMFINAPISPQYYFKEDLPCDAPFEHIFNGRCYNPNVDGWGISIVEFCNTHVLNAHFNRKEVVNNNKKAWLGHYLGFKYQLQAWLISLLRRSEFQHFYTLHNEKACLKSIYEDVWAAEPEMLKRSCTRFREDVSVNSYLYRQWQLASNQFYPINQLEMKKVVQLEPNSLKIVEEKLFDTKIKSLCINDSSDCSFEDYERMKPLVKSLFERKFPEKSSFEK